MGCVTKVTEYSKATTMPNRMMVTATTTNAQILTSNKAMASSADRGRLVCWFCLFNLFLQDRRNQVFRASLCELTARLLTPDRMEVVRVLAIVSVLLFTACQQHQRQNQFPHLTTWQCFKISMPPHSMKPTMTAAKMMADQSSRFSWRFLRF